MIATVPPPARGHRSWHSRRRLRRTITVAGITVLLAMIGGGVAIAHPALRPAEVPAGEPAELELVMEHDCDPVNGADDPTTAVAIQVPDAIAAAEALPLSGWQTGSETDGEGRTTVIEWTVEEGASPDTPPTLPLRLTPATASESLDLDLVVLQECSEGSYLWGGGDEDEPPIALTVTPGTYEEPTEAATHTPAATPTPSSAPTSSNPPASAPTSTEPTAAPSLSAQPEEPSGTLGPVLWALGAFTAAAAAIGLFTLRRRRSDG